MRESSGAVGAVRVALILMASAAGLLVVMPVLLVGLPFWAISELSETAAELVKRVRGRTVTWREIIEYEPVVGWKPRPHLDTHVEADGVCHVTTDADGWRGRTTLAESEVVVIGDSFAFGYGADDRTFFAERTNGTKIKAIGANGYNMVQEPLWMQRLGEHLRNKTVVWLVYYGNDLFDNLQPNVSHYRMPFVRQNPGTAEWEIVTSHVRPDPWPHSTAWAYQTKLSEICSETYLSQRAFGACAYLIREGTRVCREAKADLVVMGVPHKWQLSESGLSRLVSRAPDPETFDADRPDRVLAEVCRRLDLGFVPLKEFLTAADYKTTDCHWNPKGDRRVSRIVSQLAREPRHVLAAPGAARVRRATA